MVVTGQKDVDRGSLVGGRDRTRKGDMSNPQLSGKFLNNDAAVGPGVNVDDQGMGALWKAESGVKQGS